MKPIIIIILKYSAILLLLLLPTWWLFDLSDYNIPKTIPHTPISIYGALIWIYLIGLLIIAEKSFLKINKESSIVFLTLCGSLVIFIAEVLFQGYLFHLFSDASWHSFFSSLLVMTILGCSLSFFIAFKLKTKQTGKLILIVAGFVLIFAVLIYLFPSIQK